MHGGRHVAAHVLCPTSRAPGQDTAAASARAKHWPDQSRLRSGREDIWTVRGGLRMAGQETDIAPPQSLFLINNLNYNA